MERDTSLDNMDSKATQQHEQDTSDETSSSWNGTGEAVDLGPSNLPIARVQRAWERKPASPLARNRFRVGKVWKRSALPTAFASASTVTADALERGIVSKRFRLGLGAQSPMRAVKKLCLDSGYGLGAQASQWDARPTESPVRKIVTRAGAAKNNDVELLELEEDDDEVVGTHDYEAVVEIGEEVGEVTIEILDEQGNAIEVQENAEDEVGNEEWEDVGEDGDESQQDNEDIAEAAVGDNVALDKEEGTETELLADNAVQDAPASAMTFAQRPSGSEPHVEDLMEDDAQLQASEEDDSAVYILQSSKPTEAEVSTQLPMYAAEPVAGVQDPAAANPSPELRKIDNGVWAAQIASTAPQQTLPFGNLVLTPKSVRSSPMTERASSAPPEEEPKPLSPEKSFKPRLSDDTALLQAFINRAQEDKSSRRLSVTQRESLSNRRDSDTVRQALASPAKPAESVLGDLDPNSPSPRKSSPSDVAEQPALNALALSTTTAAAPDEADPIEDPEQSAQSSTKTRRSVRGRRKPQVLSQSVYSAPPSQRIQIRGANATVDLKKSEAQELALLTRTNTRKNKQGSVLPKMRLVKMPPQDEGEGSGAGGDGTEGSSKEGRRGVKWNEQLVSFFEPGSVDTSGWSDEGPEERMPWERPALPDDSDEETEDVSKEEASKPEKPKAKKSKEVAQLESTAHTMGLTMPTPVPAAETPSKPKIRRLKAPRTASTPAKGPTPVLESDLTPAEQAATATGAQVQKPASTLPKPKRSRIATPAKGLTNASLLPTDVPIIAEKKPAPPPAAKKRLASKLPAPAPVASAPNASSSATASIAGQGKENLTASPPKRPSVPQSKLFAPKLDFSSSVVGSKSAGATFPNLQAQQQQQEGGGGGESAVPGLSSSPAKKGRGRVVVGLGGRDGGEGGDSGGGGGNEGLGLKSPARKRSARRAGAG